MFHKHLYIVRHAKADEKELGKIDYRRNIIQKGEVKSNLLANKLAESFTIDNETLFISSSANRALQTAELTANILEYPLKNIQIEKTIYEAHPYTILNVINKVPDQVNNVFIFGHNPGLSMLVEYLTGEYNDLKTSDIAVLEVKKNTGFADLKKGAARIIKKYT